MLPTKNMELIANGLRLDMNKRNAIGEKNVYVEFTDDNDFICATTYVHDGVLHEEKPSPLTSTYVKNRIIGGFFTVEDVLAHFDKSRIFLVMNKDRSYWSEDPFAA